ncbi:hypothetical protein GQ457_11G007170 [Hibiscus cannabinus]
MLKVELDRSFNLYTLIPYAYSITDVFSASGDLNLTLLGHLVAEPVLSLIGCCNELKDGYPRACGVAACVVTITVDGRGQLFQTASPVLIVTICLLSANWEDKTNDYGTNRIVDAKLLVEYADAYLFFGYAYNDFRELAKRLLMGLHSSLPRGSSTTILPMRITDSCSLKASSSPKEPLRVNVLFHSASVTAQDVSTMLRCGLRSRIFLINNGGYTIEFHSIHDGPYNLFKNWNQTSVADSIHSGGGKC